MKFSKMTARILVSSLIVVSMLISMLVCAVAVNAADARGLAAVGANTYYFYGQNSNSPEFGGMNGPSGTMSYDSSKGYYYYDITGSGDYCFVISKINGNGAQAVGSPAVGNVAETPSQSNYYLQQGGYHGYICMHLYNPSGDKIRIYFRSESSGLYAIKAGADTGTPTQPQTSATQAPTTPSGSGGYVYCENAAGWSTVKAYMWVKGTDNKASEWPGTAMTNIGGNIWRYQVPSGYNMIIFNNGNSGNGNQSTDQDFPGAGYIFNNQTNTWRVYSESSTTATQATSATQPATQQSQTTAPSGKKLIFCKNEAGWNIVKAYMWNKSTQKSNADWSGVNMTKVEGNIWQYEYPSGFDMIIFTDGNAQSDDLSFPGAGYIYNNATKEWSVYDTSPLQVTAYTTDLESPVYNGVVVTLSATARGQGTVAYQFSATNNTTGQSTVLQTYSTKNYTTWTPAAAGTYTLKYEFRDTSGNTNSRTKTFTVENGQSAVSPYIKSVTPGSGQIQKGKACAVLASAGGGITGTKLLFYKFTITDPTGKIVNTPYYSLTSSASFTPTALGNYTLTVSVQGSDNAVDERNCVLKSVNTVETENYGTIASEAPSGAVLKGDADSDGDLSILDATRIQRYLAELEPASKVNFKNADTDGDNLVTILDVTRIQRVLAQLPVEDW